MSRNLSESIALMLAAESIAMDELLDARLSLEVPLARGGRNATAEIVERLEEAIADAERHAPGEPIQRGRRPLPPDARRGGGQRPAARVHRLDPRSLPAVADRADLGRVEARGDPRASTAPSRAPSGSAARRRREGDARAPPAPARRAHVGRLSAAARTTAAAAAARPLLVGELPLLHLARRRARAHRHADRDVGDPVLAVEHHRRRPTARRRRARSRRDHPRDAGAGRPGRGAAGVQRDVPHVPAAHEVGGPARCGGVQPTGAPPTATRLSSGTQRSPCSPSTQASTRPRRHAERSADRRAQPQRCRWRVAEHPPAVEAGPRREPGDERVDRVGDHDAGRRPSRAAARRRSAPGSRRCPQVGHARAVHGQRRGGGDDHDVGLRELGQRADADRARAAQREHLLEVHLVRGGHPRAAVDEDDVVGLGPEQEVEARRRSRRRLRRRRCATVAVI